MYKYPISVFIDTNIFINAKYDFSENGIFQTLLNHINSGKIQLYLSDIVVHEVEKHLLEAITLYLNKMKKARAEAINSLSVNFYDKTIYEDFFNPLNKNDLKSIAKKQFEKFIVQSNAIILDSDGVDVNKIASDYMNGIPPFALEGKKKHEFPDAIMSAKLQLMFSVSNPIYVVCADNGFKESLTGKEGFYVYKELNDIFNLISKQEELYSDIKAYITSESTLSKLNENIKVQLYDSNLYVDGREYDRKGNCVGYDYEETQIEKISNVDATFNSVDEISNGVAFVSLVCSAKIDIYATFIDFDDSLYDSEEKQYIRLTKGYVNEVHKPLFMVQVKILMRPDNYEMEKIVFDIALDQHSRISQKEYFENPEEDARGEMMDALEEYYNH